MLISKEKRSRSNKWRQEDILKAFKLKAISRAGFDYVRENIIPLPSKSKVYNELRFLRLDTGILKPATVYLGHIRQQTEDNPLERLSSICFDETSTSNRAEWDEIFDTIRGKMIGSTVKPNFVYFCQALIAVLSILFTFHLFVYNDAAVCLYFTYYLYFSCLIMNKLSALCFQCSCKFSIYISVYISAVNLIFNCLFTI